MLKAGICAPYTKSENTLAAVQFADWLVRCGFEVSFISSTKISQGLHPYWDTHVSRNTNRNVYKWAYGASHLCWFEPALADWNTAKLVTLENRKRSVQNLFFPGFMRWNSDADYFLAFADKTICLAQDISTWLKSFRKEPSPQDFQLSRRTWANLVSPSKVLAAKYGYIEKDAPRLFVFCLKEWDIDLPQDFLMLFDELLSYNSKVRITIAFDKSIATKHRKTLKAFKLQHGDRFEWKTRLSWFELLGEARKHDWVYVAGTRFTYGSLFSLFAASTVPLICHDIPPIGAHVSDKANGKLIPCGLSKARVPIGEVRLQDIGETLFEAMELPHVSIKALQIAGRKLYEKKQESFERFVHREIVGCENSLI